MGSSNSGTFSDVIEAQGFPRRRARGASHAHERATRWATRCGHALVISMTEM